MFEKFRKKLATRKLIKELRKTNPGCPKCDTIIVLPDGIPKNVIPITLCLDCKTVLLFDVEKRTVREPFEHELKTMKADPVWDNVQEALTKFASEDQMDLYKRNA